MESSVPGGQVHQAQRLPGLDGVAGSDLLVEEGEPGRPPSSLALQEALGSLGEGDVVPGGPLLVGNPEATPVRDCVVLGVGGVLG